MADLLSSDAELGEAVKAVPSAPAPSPAAPPASAEPSTMVGADGKIYHVPSTSVDKALRNGWKVADATDIERERKVQLELKSQEEWHGYGHNPIEESAKRIANEALLGIPQLIGDKNASPDELRVRQAVRERQEEAHPLRSGAEKVAGFAGTLAVPGVGAAGEFAEGLVKGAGELGGRELIDAGIKEGAQVSLKRAVAASAAKVATESAIYSAPQAAVQAAYGDPEQAAETMLWGIGLGGVLGAGGTLLGAGAKALAGKAAETVADHAEILSRPQANGLTYADDLARNVFGITDRRAKELGSARVARIMENADREGILSADPKTWSAKLGAMGEDAGTKLGEHRASLEERLQDPELRKSGPVPTSVAQEFQEQVQLKHPELLDDLHSANAKFATDITDRLGAGGNDPSFLSLEKAGQSIAKTVTKFEADSPKGEMVRLAKNLIRKHVDDAAQKLFEAGEVPEKFADYLKQKGRYEASEELSRGLNDFKGTGRVPGALKGVGLGTVAKIGLGAMHGPLGMGLAGMAIAKEYAMRKFLANEGGLLGKSASFLRKVAADPASAPLVGGLMAKEGVSALTAHLDALPSYLSGSQTLARGTTDVVRHLVGDTTGLSKQQQYDKVVAQVNRAANEVDTTAQKAGALASTFTGTSVELANLVAQKKLQAVSYLQSQVPKDPHGPVPFQRAPAWKPSPEQQRDYLRKVAIVQDPMIVWEHYQKGDLTAADRDTLKAVYPSVYTSMVHKIMATAYDPRAPELDHAKRLQLTMFTGLPLDSSVQNASAITQALATPAPQQPTNPPGRARPSTRPKLNSPSLQTDSQRRTYGEKVA